MRMVKNLSLANIRNIEGLEEAKEYNFSDDGNYFRGFCYKGLPITTLRYANITYLCIRVDYLSNDFTYKDWADTTESKLCQKYNGVEEFDIEELVKDCEAIWEAVRKLNSKVAEEKIDTSAIRERAKREVELADEVISNVRKYFDWVVSDKYTLAGVKTNIKSFNNQRAFLENIANSVETMPIKELRQLSQRLQTEHYLYINAENYYITKLNQAIEQYRVA